MQSHYWNIPWFYQKSKIQLMELQNSLFMFTWVPHALILVVPLLCNCASLMETSIWPESCYTCTRRVWLAWLHLWKGLPGKIGSFLDVESGLELGQVFHLRWLCTACFFSWASTVIARESRRWKEGGAEFSKWERLAHDQWKVKEYVVVCSTWLSTLKWWHHYHDTYYCSYMC